MVKELIRSTDAAAAGAKRLDAKYPDGWVHKTGDLRTFDMGVEGEDVLTRVCGNYEDGLTELGIVKGSGEEEEYGFMPDGEGDRLDWDVVDWERNSRSLTEAWFSEIQSRLKVKAGS